MSLVLLIVASAIAVRLLTDWLRHRGPRHPFKVGSPEADASTLEALRRTGADLTRDTDIVFYLYFNARSQAEGAAAAIGNPTFVPKVEQAADMTRWLCRVDARLVPSSSTIRDASVRLQAVAATMGGSYDGWEAAVESDGAALRPVKPMAGDFPLAKPPINALVKWFVACAMYVSGPRRLLATHRVPVPEAPKRLSAADEAAMPAELRGIAACPTGRCASPGRARSA